MIGLVDLDLQSSTSETLIPPNIEIMKLANYYKNEQKQFVRLIDLNETNFDGYDKIYFFSEFVNHAPVPEQFFKAPNIIYGGTGFTNKIYQPFKEELIDYTLPRIFVYKNFLQQKYNDGILYKVINHVLDDSYYRNYAGTNKLPVTPIQPKKRIFLYDRDFFYDDWQDTIQYISEQKPSSIFRIHPIRCTKISQFFAARKFNKLAKTNTYIFDFDIPLKEMDYLLKNYKLQLLAEINSASKICIPFGGDLPSAIHYYKDFIYKINLLYSFWSKGIMMRGYYEYPSLGFKDPIANLNQFVVNWTKSASKTMRSIKQRVYLKSYTKKEIAKDIELIIKLYPYTKDLFTQTFLEISKRGVWRI